MVLGLCACGTRRIRLNALIQCGSVIYTWGLNCAWGAVQCPELGKLKKIARKIMMRPSGRRPDVVSCYLSSRSQGLIIVEEACNVCLGPILIVGEHNRGFGVHFEHI